MSDPVQSPVSFPANQVLLAQENAVVIHVWCSKASKYLLFSDVSDDKLLLQYLKRRSPVIPVIDERIEYISAAHHSSATVLGMVVLVLTSRLVTSTEVLL